jgi:hypothetical protein
MACNRGRMNGCAKSRHGVANGTSVVDVKNERRILDNIRVRGPGKRTSLHRSRSSGSHDRYSTAKATLATASSCDNKQLSAITNAIMV